MTRTTHFSISCFSSNWIRRVLLRANLNWMSKTRHLITIAFLFITNSLFASSAQKLVGRVYYENTGNPIKGVEVIPATGTNLTYTDDNGLFELIFPEKQAGEVVSIILKKSKHRIRGNKTNTIRIILPKDAQEIVKIPMYKLAPVPPPPPPPLRPKKKVKYKGLVRYEDGSPISGLEAEITTNRLTHDISLNSKGSYTTAEITEGDSATLVFRSTLHKIDTSFSIIPADSVLISTRIPLPKYSITGSVVYQKTDQNPSNRMRVGVEGVRISTSLDKFSQAWTTNSRGEYEIEIKARPKTLITLKFDKTPEYILKTTEYLLPVGSQATGEVNVKLKRTVK